MNTSKYKATTVLTGEGFPPLSRLSTETFNPKFLSITLPHENTLLSEIVRQTQDSRCNKTLPQTITTGYNKSKLKAENLTVIKTCPTTARQRDIIKKTKPQSRNHKFYPTSYAITYTITYTISTTIYLFRLITETSKQNRSN